MAVKVGILGLGFMGKCHYDNYGAIKGAKVVAICDVDRKKRSGDWSGIAGNIGGAGKKQDLSRLRLYTSAEKMFKDPDIDVVDITLPTYLHAEYALKAFKAGKHVICEKPIARNSAEARKMLVAAKQAGKRLFVAHCIRFWPEYAEARAIVRSKKQGKMISAVFTRLSLAPTWSWRNWLQDGKRSGSAALDLHIHDSDFILYTFGKPKAVTSSGVGFTKGRQDHILTTYDYGAGKLVSAEGAWEYAPGFGFTMSFRIHMEKATLVFDGAKLMLHPVKGKSAAVKVPKGDGYYLELKHFVDCLAKKKSSSVVTPASALKSLKLVEAEIKSVQTGKRVVVRL